LSNKTIILFTSSFPYGHGEQFVEAELKFLSKSFVEIYIFPYHYGDSVKIREGIPGNVIIQKPFRDENHNFMKLLYKGMLNTRLFFPYWNDLLKNPGILLSWKKLSLWFRSMLNCRMILQDKRLLNCITRYHSNLIFYFYWGHRPSGIAIELRKLKWPIVMRFHGTDLYKELKLNNNYIPFREMVLNSISDAIFISDHGANYIRNNFDHIPARIMVHRLGTLDHGTYQWDSSDILRIVSCSAIDENKRIWIIALAIARLDFPIEWTHIGDGPLMNELSQLCKVIDKSNVTVNLLGMMTNQDVHEIYRQKQFDIFINTSKSEGIPVSIMEALSYSIPVMATAVGGIPEIIDQSCGMLLPIDITSEELGNCLSIFHTLGIKKKISMRNNARKRWDEMYNAEKNYLEFTLFMGNL